MKDDFSNEAHPKMFNFEIMPDETIRHRLLDYSIPLGYKVDEEGTHKRRATNTGFSWTRVSPIISTITHIKDVKEYGYPEYVDVIFCNGIWDEFKTATLELEYIFSTKVATLLRKEGAICTTNDGRRLADYFRECYILRVREAMRE
jgi:hypothetical protein